MTQTKPRVTILWSHWSGYMDACARALVEEQGCELTIVYLGHGSAAPFVNREFFNYPCQTVQVELNDRRLPAVVTDTPADVVLVAGWHIPAYLHMVRRARAVRILCMDNQWLGTLRQWLGVLLSRWLVRPYFDHAMVPGPRQAAFARKLGFAAGRVSQGHYACDYAHFRAVWPQRQARPLSRSFLYVGRFVEDKAIDVLLKAWSLVAGETDWRLQLVGAGAYPWPSDLPSSVTVAPFVQPSQLPQRMLDGDVFVLPSRFEPWGLVVHEAASTGMPVICTDACGAGDLFVKDGSSGFVVKKDDAEQLAGALRKIMAMTDDAIRAMGAASQAAASLRTPSTWAKLVLTILKNH